jgi:hypothetical protein
MNSLKQISENFKWLVTLDTSETHTNLKLIWKVVAAAFDFEKLW